MLLLLNAHYEAVPFTLPATREGELWERLLDTADPQGLPVVCTGGQQYELQGRAMTVLRIKAQPEEAP
jgi:glycogen operon protein